MKNILVSIIIPVYNSEKLLSKCLDALLVQTYSNIEIICINDKSKDDSLLLIRKYIEKDNRIILVNHEENKNAGGARNSGLKIAKGEYVCFVDNDDWLAENALELLVEATQEGANDFVACNWSEYYSEKKQDIKKNFIVSGNKQTNIEYALKYGYRLLGALVRRSIFIDNNLFFPEFIFFEDNAISFVILYYANNIVVVDRVLYYYACFNESITSSTSIRKITDRVKTTDMLTEELKNRGFYEKDKELIDFKYLYLMYRTIILLAKLPLSDAKPILESVKSKMQQYIPNRYISILGFGAKMVVYCPLLTFYLVFFKNKISISH